MEDDEAVAGPAVDESAPPDPEAAPRKTVADRVSAVIRTWGWPEAVLGLFLILWSYEFIRLPMLRYDRYGTFGFDLGIYDQGTWLLSRFHDPFVTIRGLELFGHHANVFLLLVAPLYWLGAGPITLLVIQVLAQASGAIAIFLLARDLLRSKWVGVALGGALLLNPTYQWLTWEFFHPDAVAIGPLLFAYWAARNGRWKVFTFAAVLAVICKEDLALAVALLGIIIWFRGDRRRGTIVAIASTAYFFFATRVLIPWQNGIGPFYDSFFGDLGKSPTEVAFNSVRHPTKTWKLADTHDRRTWYWNMLAPWAFVPLLDPRALLVGAAAIFINIVSSFPYTRDYRFHYSAIVVGACAVATVEAIAWISNTAKERLATMWSMVTAVVVATLVASVLLGAAPYSRHYHDGTWPLASDPAAIKDRAVRSIPKGAAASVAYNIDTHMTHRSQIYEFPVPWCNINWGVHGEHLDDPADVKYLLLDRQFVQDPRDKALLSDLLSNEFTIVSDDHDILVAKRVHPPTASARCEPARGGMLRPPVPQLVPEGSASKRVTASRCAPPRMAGGLATC